MNKYNDNSIKLDDELIKYYDNLINQIKKDYENGKYQLAINRCHEELEQPYIPFEYISEFENLAHKLEVDYQYKQLDENLKKLNHEQMINTIFDGSKFNVYLFDYFLDKFSNELTNNDFDIIQLWLKNSVIENSQKFYILDSLAHFNIDKSFIFYNANVDDDIVLNTLSFHEHKMFDNYNNSLKNIENDLFKEPTIAKFSIDLLNEVANHFFPIFPFSSSEELTNIILDIINHSLNFVQMNYEKMSDGQRKVYNIFLQMQNNDL